MSLGNAIKGARHTPIEITWKDSNGNAFDLSGGTLSGVILNADDDAESRAIDGDLDFVTDGSDGKFTWTRGANDLSEESKFYVQFKNLHDVDDYDLTKITEWNVLGIVEEL